MKNLIFPTVLLLTIVCLWFGVSAYTEKTGAEMVESMEAVFQYSADDDWTGAKANMSIFMKQWDDSSKFFSLYMHEEMLQSIENSVERCQGYIKIEDRVQACGEASEIICDLKLIMGDDRFKLPGLL